MSIRQLGAACGFGKRSIYRWDRNIPSVDKVRKVADYLGTTVEELLEEESHDNFRNKGQQQNLADCS